MNFNKINLNLKFILNQINKLKLKKGILFNIELKEVFFV